MKYRKVEVEKFDGTKIPSDEPVFVLRAQDILAPLAVRYYADLVEGATANEKAAQQIRVFAKMMANWQKKKLPD